MARRLIALVLWSYFAWYLAAMLAAYTGGPAAAGPAAAVLTAMLAAVGWARSARRAPASGVRVSAEQARPTTG